MSDVETSFYNEDVLKEKSSPVDNKIPRSPAVAAYESYAAWRKKKFPPKALDYNAEDYVPPSAKNANENYSTQRQSDFDSKKSSYFPTDDENPANHNQPDSRLPPRSSYFSPDLENLHVPQKVQERRSFPSHENREKYNPNLFQGNGSTVQLNSNAARRSFPENRISREAENCLKLYSSSPSDSRQRSVSTPRRPSQFPAGSKRSEGQREVKSGIPVEYSRRASPNANALQPVRCQEYRPFPTHSTCPVDHRSRDSESGEMVKGLLKLIDNQNEQIKNLQSQLDRLLSIHEETLKDRAKCMCSMEISRQNPQICMQAYNAALQRKSAITDSYSHHDLAKFPEFNQGTTSDASKKALMERKVSIGVMTSFELTVQNSPFNNEAESQPIEEEETYQEIANPQDISKRKPNLFSRMPSALENITEDSESHLSSSQQPSSNCLSSCKGGNTQTRKSTSPNNNPQNTANVFSHYSRSNSPNNLKRANTPQSESNFRKPDRTELTPGQKQGQSRTKVGTQEMKSSSPTVASDQDEENYREKEGALLRQRRFDSREIENKDNFQEESLVLGEEQVQGDRSPPSPAPSIHIDMQDFSSEEGSVLTKRTPRVGWTFYNNVLGQVNHILQNSPLQDPHQDPRNKKAPQLQELDNNLLIDTVKAATMDQLTKLGISFADNEREANANKKVTFDTSYYSRLNPEINMVQGSSIMTETSTSMHMKALAMKYLKEEQISDAVQQKQKRDALSNLMVSNVQGTTNMSFATMRYLQRYQLLPESMNGLVEDEGKENFQAHDIGKNREAMPQKPRINLPSRPAIAPVTRPNCPSKILDISTLKQQPKLL
ncbi:uncharacterized protein LOC122507516 [Leptopilina heterotoma]|uniref:uncharacterized protein LOC122507516 n=1 Tax=Leptopilina heterotoma TaxID=63436 RepID=UPI001CA7BEE9|nr:uncharacterized protein LOC122507516 [Leptopilina heterotoma]XP_043476202.1 uncharacterized protein LOC122507516 [Leptopilina heterotoma]